MPFHPNCVMLQRTRLRKASKKQCIIDDVYGVLLKSIHCTLLFGLNHRMRVIMLFRHLSRFTKFFAFLPDHTAVFTQVLFCIVDINRNYVIWQCLH